MFSITISGESLAQIAFNAARLAEEITAQIQQEKKDEVKKDEPLPETPAPEKTAEPKGRGRRQQAPANDKKSDPEPEPEVKKDAPKTDAKPTPTRSRRGSSKKVEPEPETEEQQADRAYIMSCMEDLGELAQADAEVMEAVSEMLQRNGLGNIAELTTPLIEQVATDVEELMDRFFEPAGQ